MNFGGADRAGLIQVLDRTMLVCLLLTVPFLLHAHGFAEVTIGLIAVLLPARSWLARDWGWLASTWVRVAFLWWGWLTICSMPIPALGLGEGGVRSFGQALMTVRFVLLAAAMECTILRDSAARRWLYGLVAASAAYIAIQSLFQFFVGRNFYGWPRYVDGELTGPFGMPRAGPPLARILMPSVLPPVVALLGRRDARMTMAAIALLLSGVVVMVLIGQRMPVVLTIGSLLVCGLMVRGLRIPVMAACVAGALILAASPVIAPNSYYRLVVKFTDQLQHFATSHYGLLYTRAAAIGSNHPFTGLGFDGFGTGCPRPEHFRPSLDGSRPDGGGDAICWVHPHNFYAQALADGGFVGLVLFAAMAIAWLRDLGRGLWSNPDPLRVGLFASVLVQLWPLQSTSGFMSMPLAGWLFLLVGWGLGESRHRSDR